MHWIADNHHTVQVTILDSPRRLREIPDTERANELGYIFDAQLREAKARWAEARTAVATADAIVVQRRNELDFAEKVWHRSEELVGKGFVSTQKLDTDRAQMLVAKAALEAARSQVAEAQAAVQASVATIERIQSDIDDSVLKAPKAGRVQYRLAEPGEVRQPAARSSACSISRTST